MANAFKVLSRAAATTSSSTLYTTPSATQALVTSFVITNTASVDAQYTITLNGVAATATTVNFSVTGLEIS